MVEQSQAPKQFLRKGGNNPKDREKIAALGCAAVASSSQLMLFHRPSDATIKILKELHGITMIVTAQDEQENVKDVKKLCEKHKLEWFWIPLRGAN